MMLYVYKDKASVLCMEVVDFVLESKHRLGIFGKCVASDLANVQVTVCIMPIKCCKMHYLFALDL